MLVKVNNCPWNPGGGSSDVQCFPCTYSHHAWLQAPNVTLPNKEWKRDVQKYGPAWMISGCFSVDLLIWFKRPEPWNTLPQWEWTTLCKTQTDLTNIMWSKGRQTQKSTVKSHLYRAQKQTESICNIRSQDSGSFVVPSDWEGQEGFRGASQVLILCLGPAYTDVDTLSYPLMICARLYILYFKQKLP